MISEGKRNMGNGDGIAPEGDPIDRKIEEAMREHTVIEKKTAQIVRPMDQTLADVLDIVLNHNREILDGAVAINFRRMPDHPEFPNCHVWHLEVI